MSYPLQTIVATEKSFDMALIMRWRGIRSGFLFLWQEEYLQRALERININTQNKLECTWRPIRRRTPFQVRCQPTKHTLASQTCKIPLPSERKARSIADCENEYAWKKENDFRNSYRRLQRSFWLSIRWIISMDGCIEWENRMTNDDCPPQSPLAQLIGVHPKAIGIVTNESPMEVQIW